MKKTKIISMAILSAVLVNSFILTACSKKNEQNYFDIDSVKEEINEGKINASTTDFKYDDKPFNIMKLNCTIDNNFFYDFMYPNMKIKLTDGKVSYVCDIPGCAHTLNSSGCMAYIDFVSPVATTEGIYYVNGNKVMLYADSKETEILRNEYYTDYETEFYPDNKNIITALCIHGRELFVICPSFYFVYDLDTRETGEMKKLTDSLCTSFAASDNYVYYTNQNLEMYIQNKNSDDNKKAADKVGQVCFTGGKLYYIQYESDVPILYSADEDGGNPVKIAQDCYVNYCVTDSCIYYQNYINGKNVYKCDLNGENAEKVVFNNLPEDYSIPILKIATCSSVDHVFFIDEEADDNSGLMFSAKKGESDTNTVMIEKDY